jgi:hypothetical protein
MQAGGLFLDHEVYIIGETIVQASIFAFLRKSAYPLQIRTFSRVNAGNG